MTETAQPRPEVERGRRRSQRSHDAIIRATQELLIEDGYQSLTIEGVAARAGVGKQTIYRWWPSRAALVLEAYLAGSDTVPPPRRTATTREDVRAMLQWLVAVLEQPIGGQVVAGLVADLKHDTDLAERFRRDVVRLDGARCSTSSSAAASSARSAPTSTSSLRSTRSTARSSTGSS